MRLLFLAMFIGGIGVFYLASQPDMKPGATATLQQLARTIAPAAAPKALPPPPPVEPTTSRPPPAKPVVVQRWTDEYGTVHYEQRSGGTADYALKQQGTMADYDRAMTEKSGITARDLERARQTTYGAPGATDTVATTAGGGTAAAVSRDGQPAMHMAPTAIVVGRNHVVSEEDLASQQAYELIDRQQAAMEQVRGMNSTRRP